MCRTFSMGAAYTKALRYVQGFGAEQGEDWCDLRPQWESEDRNIHGFVDQVSKLVFKNNMKEIIEG